MLVTLDGNQLMTKLGNQPRMPIFPQSETMFFAKAVDAQIEFAKPDSQGVPGQLILHQNGRDQSANRLSDAEFKQIAAAADAADKRFKDQTAAPGSEVALRRLIEETRTGQPNYDLLGAGLAAATRQQLPQLQGMIKQAGAVKSVSFKGVGPGGADIYEVKFDNGSFEYRISMASDVAGKIDGAGVRPVQ